ncbi:hypothetical protein KP509_20G013400 [Ceratopteris richardii]|uniref:Tubby C-terminal domain-containing protein n=2 Tax=Ceratopteris richardii TaxID=49495 RepID=A0A8T2SGH2_CERRI|nr:hypothetical protein KP509_20G013400 [Ceratopteris richardii]
MSPYKNSISLSQQVLYKSYTNPLSDSAEHTLSPLDPASSFSSDTITSSSTSICSSSASLSSSCPSSSSSSWRSSKDQAETSSAFSLRRFVKSNDASSENSDGQSLMSQDLKKLAKGKQCLHPTLTREARRREPLRLAINDYLLNNEKNANRLQNEEKNISDSDSEEKAPLFPPSTPTFHSHVWDEPDCEVGPASAWSTLGNRTLLCRPLPLDVGCCVCYIKRERQYGRYHYVLYTDEGNGRQDRKLALAVHKMHAGRSEFVAYVSGDTDSLQKSEAILGRVRANFLGSQYTMMDDFNPIESGCHSSPNLLGVVMFQPTVSSLTGTYRVLRAFIPMYQSTQISPLFHREKVGLAPDWKERLGNVYTLYSRKPHYNKITRCYELDFRERAKRSLKIMTSANNMLLTMNENGKQAVLIFAKVGKSKYLVEYRFPLTAYQAFGICLSSLDTKICCSF